MAKGYVECDSCGERLYEGETAIRIDDVWYCHHCGIKNLEYEYSETVDELSCLEDEDRREQQDRIEAEDAEYDAYKARMDGIDY